MKTVCLLTILTVSAPMGLHAENPAEPLEPWLARAGTAIIEEDFTSGEIAKDWFFTEWWSSRDGVLLRNDLPGENKRLFWKKPSYRDAVISFSFSFRGAEEIRLMSGTPGKYNFVVRIRRDHFRVNTASDSTAGHLPSIQGECPFRFEAGTWYRLRVEVLADEVLARIDDEHFVVGRHPIIDRRRSYFAFQVDGPSAAFDNVRLLSATGAGGWEGRRAKLLQAQAKRPWLPRNLDERHKDRKIIARDQAWRTDARYRELVERHESLRELAREQFPAAHISTKEARKKIAVLRKKLLQNDAEYKTLTRAINKARRNEDLHLQKKNPHLETLPSSGYKAALKKLRLQARDNDPGFIALLEITAALENKRKNAYPQLERTNDEIVAERKAAWKKLHEASPDFRNSNEKVTKAWREVQAHLLKSDPELARLEKERQAAKKREK